MFDYLPSDKERQLFIKIDLGYLLIPPIAESSSSAVIDKTINPFYPNPGGKQQESLYYQNVLNKFKSQTLSTVSNGIMPQHIDITGAPFCTFLEGTISNTAHPYYDLLKSDEHVVYAKTPEAPTVFNSTQPVQQSYQTSISNNNVSNTVKQVNSVGSVYCPATTKTNAAIQKLNLNVSTTYNIWTLDNLPFKGGIATGFNFLEYLGWFPQQGQQIQNLQPYAQTWPLSDMSMIQVYSSYSQISLTRKYPIYKDYVHDSNARYVIYNSGDGSKQTFTAQPLGFDKNNTTPVGFVLKFNAVVSNTQPLPANSSGQSSLTEPKMLISWGNLDVDPNKMNDQLNNSTPDRDQRKHIRISLYTLELSANRSPRLYINYNPHTVLSGHLNANERVIELSNIKPLNSPDKNSGAKTNNDYTLYVFYSGQYLKIGNEADPNSWSDIKTVEFNSSKEDFPILFDHYLDQNSKINILAQYMNFAFSYGQPLFSPYDPNNTIYNADDTLSTTNTLNQVSSQNMIYVGANCKYATITDYVVGAKKEILSEINKNASNTFDPYSSDNTFGPPTAYFDARCGFNPNQNNGFNIDIIYAPAPNSGSFQEISIPGSQAYIVNTKITLPKTLGGHVFNYHNDKMPGEPSIKSSYAYYFTDTDSSGTYDISSFLTSNLVGPLKVDKNLVETNGNSILLTSKATFNFINLNDTDFGKKILRFMRNNVSVIRLQAGYGNNLNTFFEGVIEEVSASQNLEKTVFEVKCVDLLQHLFEDNKTLIVSRQRINFFGQKYYDIINYLCDKTELKNHFAYDLGPLNQYSLYSQLVYDGQTPYKPLFRLPPISGNAQVSNLNRLSVGAFVSNSTANGNNTTYLGVLKQIVANMITDLEFLKSTVNGPNVNDLVDNAVMYWYADATANVDGIKLSSRNGKNKDGSEKDQDAIFIRKSSLEVDQLGNLSSDINYLDRLMVNQEIVSNTNTNNLMTTGLYRGFDNAGQMFVIQQIVSGSFPGTPPTLYSIGYVGYNRTLVFDNPKDNDTTQTTLPQTIMGNPPQAYYYIHNILNAWFAQVLESIRCSVYVTKPLKEWGNFKIYFEDEKNPIDTDKFFYNNVSYEFDIDNNLIKASINGSKKPLYN